MAKFETNWLELLTQFLGYYFKVPIIYWILFYVLPRVPYKLINFFFQINKLLTTCSVYAFCAPKENI